MEQDSRGHGAKNTQIRWEACGGLECWLSPGGQVEPAPPPPGLGLYSLLPHPQSSSLKPSPQASKHKTIQKENLPL